MSAVKEMTPSSIFVVDAKHIWLDDDTTAANMFYSTKYFQQTVACLPDFPKPRIVGGRRRWNWAAISNWIDAQTSEPANKIGRPRKSA